jgi:hypothetical protein
MVTDATMTARPSASASTASGPLAGLSPNTAAPKTVAASGFATLRTGSDTCSGAWV